MNWPIGIELPPHPEGGTWPTASYPATPWTPRAFRCEGQIVVMRSFGNPMHPESWYVLRPDGTQFGPFQGDELPTMFQLAVLFYSWGKWEDPRRSEGHPWEKSGSSSAFTEGFGFRIQGPSPSQPFVQRHP